MKNVSVKKFPEWSAKIKQVFGQTPKVFRNSSLIYSNEIGSVVASMGFKGILTEGANMCWDGRARIMFITVIRLQVLSSCCGISNSLTTSVCVSLIQIGRNILCLPISILTGSMHCHKKNKSSISLWNWVHFGMAQPLSSNILEFMKALPECAKAKGITFSTPTEIVTKLKSVSQLDVAYPMSWWMKKEILVVGWVMSCNVRLSINCIV